MSEQKFIRAKASQLGSYEGQIYQYEADGKTVRVIWRSPFKRYSKNKAIDDAAEYADANDIDAETDFGD